jgi:2-aminoadipate transaminase
MEYRFARRMTRAPKSFLDELFRVSRDPEILSFAGGLPASDLIDVEGIALAASDVLCEEGRQALQYSTTDGYLPLREYIASRYRNRLNIPADPSDIQIVNGSQQCLDLVAKIFLDPGDRIGIERPGYLGAAEAFSLYEPEFHPVSLSDNGPVIEELYTMVKRSHPKFFYGIPNSQNPSGVSYSLDARKAVGECLEDTDTVFYEDDAFGELFFDGKSRPPIKKYLEGQTIMSGSFSKIISPGLRIGWLFAPQGILKQFNVAKQAADLHSNFLAQKILFRYLENIDIDLHLRKICRRYGENCRLMSDLLDDLFPAGMSHTNPVGGMFMMATLPPKISSMKIFTEGIREKVAVLPGIPFYVDGGGEDTIRLNFSNASQEQIREGLDRLATVIRRLQ